MITWFEFVLISLASFRLTRLLIYDKITFFIRRPFHEIVDEELPDGTVESYLHIKGRGLRRWIGELLSCYWCTGIWSSLLLYGAYYFNLRWVESFILILAIAGFAAIIEATIDKIINR